jgi:transcriptional regulator with XRE-family HTH domain
MEIMADLLTTVAKNIAELRRKAGLSQHEMAARLGVARPRISEIESGAANLTLETLNSVAAVLGVPPARLLKKNSANALAKK